MASAEKRGKSKKPWRARYKRPDGTWGSEPGFATKAAALKFGRDQEADVTAGRWRDPRGGDITLAEWWAVWFPAQDYAGSTWDAYDSYWRNHIEPWRGSAPIGSITATDVQNFRRDLRGKLAAATITKGVMLVLRMLMEDAVAEQRLQASPVVMSRRQRKKEAKEEKLQQRKDAAADKPARKGIALELRAVLAVAVRLPADVALMVLIAAFMGFRWGELIGMRRRYLMLMPAESGRPASGWYIIDDLDGAVKQDRRGTRTYGPPKTGVGRTVMFPPFLVELLLDYLDGLPIDQDELFLTGAGTLHLRSGTAYQKLVRACDGQKAGKRKPAIAPVAKGVRWHDLRHTAKTWLVEDGVPDVMRDEALGHARNDRSDMDHVYVHATAAMRAQRLAVLQRRWGTEPALAATVAELISHFSPNRRREARIGSPVRQVARGQDAVQGIARTQVQN